MSTRVDVEDIQTTTSEKLLALVLAGFLLIGGIWVYQRIDDEVRDAVAVEDVQPSAADQATLQRLEDARVRLDVATQARAAARDNLELRREAYRTALDAGRQAPQLERAYERAQARFRRAQREVATAQQAFAAAQPAAGRANDRIAAERERREDRRDLLTFLLRFALVAASVGIGYWLLARLRRRGSRYFMVAVAVVAYAAILALVFAADYITDYVDPLELGPLVLSLFGIAATLIAFMALQRYLARRLPLRRVRKRECPFCGYPVRGTTHCEGCGRQAVAGCSACGADRRVGVLHCGACGAL
ncbi:MAG TPA: zinc ribbon domain-containing protein [Gaiellaceae bacterium]|nr:zinc ribbon domain-containing protein [Gaiellaceae bacterium]